jgi:hypothetical protein
MHPAIVSQKWDCMDQLASTKMLEVVNDGGQSDGINLGTRLPKFIMYHVVWLVNIDP